MSEHLLQLVVIVPISRTTASNKSKHNSGPIDRKLHLPVAKVAISTKMNMNTLTFILILLNRFVFLCLSVTVVKKDYLSTLGNYQLD